MIDELKRLIYFVLMHPLGRKNKLRSLARLTLWQARSRLSAGPHIVSFVNQTLLWARKGEAGVTGNIYVGLHEFHQMTFIAHLLRRGELFADIGANAGSYTILASGAVGARTVSVEPVLSTRRRLEQNVALNGLEDLVAIKGCALSASSGCVQISTNADCMNKVIDNGDDQHPASLSNNRTMVPALSANELFKNEGPLIAKIDVEGHEEELLKGADALLSSHNLTAVVIELSNPNDGSAVGILRKHGFRSAEYHPFERRIFEAHPTYGSGNTLFIRSNHWEFVSERVARANPIYAQGCSI